MSLGLEIIKTGLKSPVSKQIVKEAFKQGLPAISTQITRRWYRTSIPDSEIPPKMLPPDRSPVPGNDKIEGLYLQKKTDYPTIINKIKDLKNIKGDLPYIAVSQAAESPEGFLDELDKHNKISSLFQMLPQKHHDCYTTQNYKTTFVSRFTRDMEKSLIPMHFKNVPSYLDKNADVVVLQLSPMDENGYLSAGTGSSYSMTITNKNKIIIGEVNKKMPKTFGTSLHISDLDYIVETDRKIYELPQPKIGPTELEIGRNVSQMINDGDTLQLGIGAIPNAVLKCLSNHKDLKIHSEMISDGVIDLYEQGVITPKVVTGFVLGSQRLYDTVNNNPDFQIFNIDYTNNPHVISNISNLVSVNSILAMDLTGSSAADRYPPKCQISGIGGHCDFGYNASRSILAFASTVTGKDGELKSKIVPFLPEGASTTMSRNDVDMVCTEYGLVELKGLSVEERVNKIISIAHPQFRDSLTKQAKELGILG